jgi:hypothetical protein
MRGRYVEINGKIHSDNIVKPISWCKSWQIAADSATFARSEALSPLYEVLCREVTLGNIVRQELASMIPVLLLDVHHNHTVLDVCAAPVSSFCSMMKAFCLSNHNCIELMIIIFMFFYKRALKRSRF